jgi:DMSO reductase anchor subunit
VLALATYLPVLALLVFWWRAAAPGALMAGLGAALALLSLATVACTAMIYASLKPVPAWRQPLVPAVYLGFALVGGGFIAALLAVVVGQPVSNMVGLALALGATGLGVFKRRYWRAIDREIALPSLAAATGLPADRGMRAWEAPHTETNYLLREMGFVLARRHATRLRVVAQWLFAWLPALLALPLYLLPHADDAMLLVALGMATTMSLLGALVERWLFFAQARHVVSVYYGGPAP